MTAEEILKLVEGYRQASDDEAAGRLAQVDAAVTGLANERDELRAEVDRLLNRNPLVLFQAVEIERLRGVIRGDDPKPPADTSWIQTTDVKAGDERRSKR